MKAFRENLAVIDQALRVTGVIAGLIGVFAVTRYQMGEHEKRITDLEQSARVRDMAMFEKLSSIQVDVSGVKGEMSVIKSLLRSTHAQVTGLVEQYAEEPKAQEARNGIKPGRFSANN